MRRVIVLACAAALLPTPAAAQQRNSIVNRILPNRRPQPPVVLGIDALRADFVARSGTDTVYFGGDSALLSAPTRAILGAQAQWLRQHPELVVRIEGHADPSDTRDHALAVGARRADAIRQQLVLLGVPAAQLTAVTMGKERPAASGFTDATLALSRRAVIVLVR